MNKNILFVILSLIILMLSFLYTGTKLDNELTENKTPIPAICSFLGEIVSISEPIKQKLPVGVRYHFNIGIKLDKISLVSPISPYGHPCSEDLSKSSIVTQYKTPVKMDNKIPKVDNINIKVGDIIVGKGAYANNYVPLLTTIEFPEYDNK